METHKDRLNHNRRYRGIVLASSKIVVDLFTIYFRRLS